MISGAFGSFQIGFLKDNFWRLMFLWMTVLTLQLPFLHFISSNLEAHFLQTRLYSFVFSNLFFFFFPFFSPHLIYYQY